MRNSTAVAGGVLLNSAGPWAFGAVDMTLEHFARTIKGQVLLAAHTDYEAVRRVASFNLLTDKKPLLISRCVDADDVARSIEFARLNRLEVAVRGGGHDVLGQSVCDGGVLIDLSLMKQIDHQAEQGRVRVTGGVLSGEVDYRLSGSGQVLALGCHPGVGVTGLTLGGGYGWVAGKFGTAADNVNAMDVVTADGQKLRATEEVNEDLFWGLRGGGGNFGVVTAIEYQAHPLESVVGGFLVYPLEQMAALLAWYQELMADAPDGLVAELAVTHIGRPLLAMTVCYAGGTEDAKAIVAHIRDATKPIFDGLRQTPLQQLTAITPEGQAFINSERQRNSGGASAEPAEADGYFNHWRGASVSKWTDPAIATFVKCLEDAPPGWSIGIGHFVHGVAARVPEGSTALPREGASSSFFFNVSWTQSTLSTANMAWVDRSLKAMAPHLSSRAYINYLSASDEESVSASYGKSYRRLQTL